MKKENTLNKQGTFIFRPKSGTLAVANLEILQGREKVERSWFLKPASYKIKCPYL